MNQLKSLQQVLTFYQQQLEAIKAKFQQQANALAASQHRAHVLAAELLQTQQQFSTGSPNPTKLAMANHVMCRTQAAILENQHQIGLATAQVDECRAELAKQMSKIETLEKVVARETETLEQHRRQREQHLADERYLNTHFN